VSPFWISLQTAAAATALTFAAGILAARLLAGWRSRAGGIVDGLFILPLVLPPTVVGFFLLLIFGRQSAIGRALEHIGIAIVFSWPATVIAAAVVAFPLMYRTALGAFEQVNPDLLGAARTLGAGEWRIFYRVLLPLARPGIVAGTVLAFARALGEFGATLMLAGNIPGRTQTMPVAIFFAAEAGDLPRAIFWVLTTAGVSLASIAALHYFGAPSRAPRPAAVAEPVSTAPLPIVASAARAELSVDLGKRYPGFRLDVQFATNHRALGLLGASGSGKSMTLRAIAGLERPDEGRIVLNGRVLFDSKSGVSLSPAARRIGVVFQDSALFPHLTVRQNIAFGLSGPDRDRIALDWARAVHIESHLDRYPGQLSGGQQQRVALARALAMRPDALLLDEPFSALDLHLRRRLEEELRAVLASYPGAVVLVTHDRDEAFRLCEQLAVLSNGRVDAAGSRDDLFASPRTLASARITGCKNLARMRPVDQHHIRVDDWGCILRVDAHVHDATFAGIRSHHVRIVDESSGENTFPCEIVEVVESPFEVTVYLRLNGGSIEAEMPRREWKRPQTPCVCLDPCDLMLLTE
jgi:molybdate transport system permease protein